MKNGGSNRANDHHQQQWHNGVNIMLWKMVHCLDDARRAYLQLMMLLLLRAMCDARIRSVPSAIHINLNKYLPNTYRLRWVWVHCVEGCWNKTTTTSRYSTNIYALLPNYFGLSNVMFKLTYKYTSTISYVYMDNKQFQI